jgi:hypothetical protein
MGVGSCPDGADTLSSAVEKPPLATVSVTATASFPSLLVTDVFCQGLPKQVSKWYCGLVPKAAFSLVVYYVNEVASVRLPGLQLCNVGAVHNVLC